MEVGRMRERCAGLQLVLRDLGEQPPDQSRLYRHIRVVQEAVHLIELPGIGVVGHVLRLHPAVARAS